jgi:hypothetical protein
MDNGKSIQQLFLQCDKYPFLPYCFKFTSGINKEQEPPPNSRHQKGDMKHIPYWGHTNSRCHCPKFKLHGDMAHGICAPLK